MLISKTATMHPSNEPLLQMGFHSNETTEMERHLAKQNDHNKTHLSVNSSQNQTQKWHILGAEHLNELL